MGCVAKLTGRRGGYGRGIGVGGVGMGMAGSDGLGMARRGRTDSMESEGSVTFEMV